MQSLFWYSLGTVLLLILHLGTHCDGAYEPGNRGANWSGKQSKTVMKKLLKIMHDPSKAIMDIVPKTNNSSRPCNMINECKNPALPEVKNILGDEKYKDMIYQAYSYRNLQNQYKSIWPDMPKFVRLTFHDCVKEEGGKTGCNG